MSNCVQYAGSTISEPHLIITLYQVADGSDTGCITYDHIWVLHIASSIRLQMACFRQYIECTPSSLNTVVCMCATTGVRCFPDVSCILLVVEFSKCSPATTAQWLLRSLRNFICSSQIRLLGTFTQGVLRLYTQLEAILNSVPAVTAV